MRMLRKEDRGNDVKRVQNIVNQIGFDSGKVDGVFGANTEKTVKEFQKVFGLVVDGIVGKNTWGVLDKAEKVKHFKVNEFRCRHCGEIKLNIDLLLKLEELRVELGNRKIIVNSGYRCLIYNQKVGGAKYSQHMKGSAADIRVMNMSANDVYRYANKVFSNGGVGKYSTFIHVDVRGYRARWNG